MPLVPLLSVAMLILPAVAWAATTTVCVNPGGTGGCFATVQGAVDSTPGDAVIDIAAGTYPERVLVNQGKKTLRGAGADVTTLSGPGIPGCPVSLCLHAPRTAVSGMTVAGVVIGVGGTTRASLTDVVVAGSGVTGVIVSRQATAEILRATIRDNADGGVTVSRGTVSIADSTIRDNQAEWGGGIRNLGGRVTVRTSTISGNSSATCGGISSEWSISGRSRTTVERSTIAANDATFGSGGICNDGVLTLRDSVVGDNSSVNGSPDCATFSSRPGHRLIVSGTSLIENTSGCTTVIPGRAMLVAGDPLLGPLQDNGGPTDTHALLPGSPAIGLLTRPASCKKADQRGVMRAPPCDLGAYEAP